VIRNYFKSKITFSVRMLFLITVGGLVFSGGIEGYAQDDFQSWNRAQLKVIDTPYVDYITYGDLRLNQDAGNLGFWLLSQKLKFDFFKYLGLGTNYSYLENETANVKKTQDEYKYQHRLELEVTPRWSWKDRLRLSNRNRLEFRWIEGRGSDNTRYRAMLEAEVPLRPVPWVKSFFMNDEVFVDFARNTISETRVTPAGISFKLYPGVDFKVFYMIQCQKGNSWSSNQIVGTHLILDF